VQIGSSLLTRRLVVSAVALTLVASCGGDDDTADAPADSIANTSTTPSTAPTAPTEPTTTPSTTAVSPTDSTTAPSTTVAADSGAGCLVGDWVVTDADLADYFDTVSINAAFDSIDATGEIRISFTENSYEWTTDYTLTLQLGDETYEAIQTGAARGTYTEAGVLTGTIDDDSRSGSIEQGGEPVREEDVGDRFVDINPARPMDSMPFSCDGPTLMVKAGPIVGAQYAVPLTPA
jgi:hypothetical protein